MRTDARNPAPACEPTATGGCCEASLPENSRSAPAIRRAVFFLASTVIMTWPMAIAPGAYYSGRHDFYLGLWNLWWVARAITDSAAQLFYTDFLFYPVGTGLEVQPLTLLQTVLATPLTLSLGPLVTYNILVMFSFWFAGWMAATWIHALTKDEMAALAGGVIFAFAPYHYTYLTQLNLLVVGVVPLYFLAAHAMANRPAPARAALAGAALAAVALASWYYGVAVAIAAIVMSAARLLRSGNLPVLRRLRFEAIQWVTCLILLLPVVLRLAPAFIGSESTGPSEMSGMGLVMDGFKFTTTTIALWSYAGMAALLLAVVGCWKNRRSLSLVIMFLGFLILSFGSNLKLGGWEMPLPFALFHKVPVLSAYRYPDRFFVVAQLALAALAALGVARLRLWVRPRGKAVLAAVSTAVILLPLIEFWPGSIPSVAKPEFVGVPHAESASPGAVFHLPVRFRHVDAELMLHQLQHERPIAGGYLTRYDTEHIDRAARDSGLMPMYIGPKPVELPLNLASRLRRYGFAYVCVQKRTALEGYEWVDRSIYGPFVLSAPVYLKQRLYPKYFPERADAVIATAWIMELSRVLGPPTTNNSLAAVFEPER